MSYYSEKLSAEKLKKCYDLAPERVKQYLEAEINHVLQKVQPSDIVLELGCGYGRVLPAIASKAKQVTGIDTSLSSIEYGQRFTNPVRNCTMVQMDAANLTFNDRTFDLVVCIQNGISAFHVDQRELMKESLRVTKPGGTVLFSSYSEKFWSHRLEWFRLQSEAGLLGEIDFKKSGDGIIVCKDGFTATTVSPEQFLNLTSGFNAEVSIVEVDNSSLFCEIYFR
ncbi:MAG TPA: class I SAM-dependent methyltransferase [Ignavibacteria bacterium]|nr:class I SAM-dependent methyltransferase [Ignavibacteria bacterium]